MSAGCEQLVPQCKAAQTRKLLFGSGRGGEGQTSCLVPRLADLLVWQIAFNARQISVTSLHVNETA